MDKTDNYPRYTGSESSTYPHCKAANSWMMSRCKLDIYAQTLRSPSSCVRRRTSRNDLYNNNNILFSDGLLYEKDLLQKNITLHCVRVV